MTQIDYSTNEGVDLLCHAHSLVFVDFDCLKSNEPVIARIYHICTMTVSKIKRVTPAMDLRYGTFVASATRTLV